MKKFLSLFFTLTLIFIITSVNSNNTTKNSIFSSFVVTPIMFLPGMEKEHGEINRRKKQHKNNKYYNRLFR